MTKTDDNLGVAPRRRGGRPASEPELSREQIVTTAERLINGVGPERFTMRSLADALGYSTMATYRHFPNKDDLLLLTASSIIDRIVLPPRYLPWDERFELLRDAVWEQVAANPWVPAYLLHRGGTSPALERLLTGVREVLVDSGLSEDDAHRAMVLTWTFTTGLLSWSEDPTPYMKFGFETILGGLKARTAGGRKRRR